VDVLRLEPRLAARAIARDDQQVGHAPVRASLHDRVEILQRVKGVEMHHDFAGRHGKIQILDQLMTLEGDLAQGVVGQADDVAGIQHLAVPGGETLETHGEVLGVLPDGGQFNPVGLHAGVSMYLCHSLISINLINITLVRLFFLHNTTLLESVLPPFVHCFALYYHLTRNDKGEGEAKASSSRGSFPRAFG
jgi:hypothetical protein